MNLLVPVMILVMPMAGLPEEKAVENPLYTMLPTGTRVVKQGLW